MGWLGSVKRLEGVIAGHQLHGSFQVTGDSAGTENHSWMCERGNGEQEVGEDFVFYGARETDLGIFQPVQVSAIKRGCWRVLKRAAKMIEGMENQPYTGRT